ncbi:putative acyltransferase CST26 [Choanephora cucurbitarum]|uniref:Putative acyltransferase CST26 n=1 Tax=Choanephora cucurbitarum TaxID=101091 RepID=A0A1C7N4I2_9FUNG|nr:putative acyltransferase CST26 [Choanephora cucurbitarum]
MKFFEFIFLKRKLEQDKDNIVNNLEKTKARNRPVWLVLFPEGTVISDEARQKSKNYAAKLNMDDLKFTLLPRTTGLKLCKDTLGNSIEWLYDLTVGYPGIEPGENPEDVMTMKRIFCDSQGPRQIHIHIRRYRVDSLPTDTEEFTEWLLARWIEKDKRMIHFNKHGTFPELSDLDNERWLGHHRTIKVKLQLQHVLKECFGYWLYSLFYIPLILLIRYLFIYFHTTYFT